MSPRLRGDDARVWRARTGFEFQTATTVIASEAKQSRAAGAIVDCFVASLLAMTEKAVPKATFVIPRASA